MRNGKLQKELDYATDVSAKIIWEAHVQEVDNVISMAAKKSTIDYSMGKEKLIPKVPFKMEISRENLL